MERFRKRRLATKKPLHNYDSLKFDVKIELSILRIGSILIK